MAEQAVMLRLAASVETLGLGLAKIAEADRPGRARRLAGGDDLAVGDRAASFRRRAAPG